MAEKHRYNRDRARTKLLLHKFIIPIRSYLNQLFLEEQSRLPSVSIACVTAQYDSRKAVI